MNYTKMTREELIARCDELEKIIDGIMDTEYYLVEVFNENENHWEWQQIRQANVTEDTARREAWAEYHGDDDKETMQGYLQGTRVFNIKDIK